VTTHAILDLKCDVWRPLCLNHHTYIGLLPLSTLHTLITYLDDKHVAMFVFTLPSVPPCHLCSLFLFYLLWDYY